MGLLLARGLRKSYRGTPVVDGVDIEVSEGEIVGLLGPNGAGKTTTFYMLVGYIRPDGGQIFLDNEEIGRLPMYERAKRGISYLPQEPSVFRKLTVKENIQVVLEVKGLQGEELREKVEKTLEEFRLQPLADRFGAQLSGGERRRTEIARAVALEPRFILLDEPFAGIDPIAVTELKSLLRYLKQKGIGILITDHNVRETLSITDRSYIINNGIIIKEGSTEELIKDTAVQETYLGREFRL